MTYHAIRSHQGRSALTESAHMPSTALDVYRYDLRRGRAPIALLWAEGDAREIGTTQSEHNILPSKAALAIADFMLRHPDAESDEKVARDGLPTLRRDLRAELESQENPDQAQSSLEQDFETRLAIHGLDVSSTEFAGYLASLGLLQVVDAPAQTVNI